MIDMNKQDCDLIQPLVGAYLDGELDGGLSERLSSHLHECSDCRILLDQISKTDALFRSDHPELPSNEEWKEIEKRIFFKSTVFSIKRIAKAASVAAAAVFLFVLLYWIVDSFYSESGSLNKPELYTTESKDGNSPEEQPLNISIDRG